MPDKACFVRVGKGGCDEVVRLYGHVALADLLAVVEGVCVEELPGCVAGDVVDGEGDVVVLLDGVVACCCCALIDFFFQFGVVFCFVREDDAFACVAGAGSAGGKR